MCGTGIDHRSEERQSEVSAAGATFEQENRGPRGLRRWCKTAVVVMEAWLRAAWVAGQADLPIINGRAFVPRDDLSGNGDGVGLAVMLP